jgi:uncharacterized alpha-E superfamily protein
MLSRTADHLFWMARYAERAENLARLLDVTYQMSLVPHDSLPERHNWNAVLVLNSLETAFAVRYDEITASNVLRFMVRDESNESSIYSCVRAARENAHAVRGTLTAEMWETLNETWLHLRNLSFEELSMHGIASFFDWVKQRASLLRGAMFGTLLQDETFHFIRLGSLLERADNTARILDVKYHGGPPADENLEASDFYYWGALLRSVSAFEVYRKVYRHAITPASVAELLILREDLPRSLISCLHGVVTVLGKIENGRSAETVRRAGMWYSELHYSRMSDIFGQGLHVWLESFMGRMYDLGNRISEDFLISLHGSPSVSANSRAGTAASAMTP